MGFGNVYAPKFWKGRSGKDMLMYSLTLNPDEVTGAERVCGPEVGGRRVLVQGEGVDVGTGCVLDAAEAALLADADGVTKEGEKICRFST